MTGGTFSVSRGIWEHPAFRDEPFTEREAWLWIVSAASWKPRTTRVGEVVVELDRGQLAAPIRFIARRWSWTPAKVQRYLKRLEKLKMIDPQTDTGVTVLRVINYEVFQPNGKAADTAAIQNRYRPDTNKNKGERREKEGKKDISAKADDFDAFWSVVPRKVAKGAARKAWAKAVKACPPSQLIDGMKRYAEQRQGQDQQFTVHPATWLNQERWQDEAPPSSQDFHKQMDHHLQEGLNDLRGTHEIGSGGYQQLPKPVPTSNASGRPSSGARDQGDSGGSEQRYLNLVKPRRFP